MTSLDYYLFKEGIISSLNLKADYYSAFPFVVNVVKNVSSSFQYKLHIYDVKNNKWLKDLTSYNEKIDYDPSNMEEGLYAVDI